MSNFLNYYKIWFGVSVLILIFGLFSLFTFGLKLGIDFTGGSLININFQQSFSKDKVELILNNHLKENFNIQTSENNGLIIKTETISKEKYDEIINSFKSEIGDLNESKFESIGPVIGRELKTKSITQLILVSLGILLYIGYAFRKVSRPASSLKFGVSAVIALFHDLLFMLGVFSILGKIKGVEVDSMFVTAVLTVLGFSVHDTIVVFDRIRENLKTFSGQTMETIINHSISQTLVRSINTSLTVLFVLLSLLLFGGESIRYFVLALFIGIIIGTYSSIFIASPALWLMHKK